MNKQKEQKLKELSNKYFWEQKTQEVGLFAIIIFAFVIALRISGSIMMMLYPENFVGVSLFVTGMCGLIVLAIFGIFLYMLGRGVWELLKEWIEENKEKAEKRAKEELKIKDEDYFY